MPYVDQASREFTAGVQQAYDSLQAVRSITPGELNYMITRLCNAYFQAHKGYGGIATVTGVLENVKQEIYRRVFVPYEDEKLKLNGDVY